MTPSTTWAAGAVLTGLLAAGAPSTAAADGSLHTPTADAIAQNADAISKCLTDHGFPPLPSGSVLGSAPAGAAGSPPAITLPGAGTITAPAPGTTTAPAAATITAPAAATITTPAAGTSTTPAAGTSTTPATGTSTMPIPAGLPCGPVTINNNVYFVTNTTTTTTTNVDGPINAAAGSINTAPVQAAPPAASAVGRPLRARGGARAGHKKSARARRVRAHPSGRPRHAEHVVRIRLIRMGHTTHR